MDFVHPIRAVIPGAQGRVLEVLADTTAELNLRTLARVAGVSLAQASRVVPGLVELGLVERREVPPSSQFRLGRTHVAAEAILALASASDTVLVELGRIALALAVPPLSVIVFGSFARGGAGRDSHIVRAPRGRHRNVARIGPSIPSEGIDGPKVARRSSPRRHDARSARALGRIRTCDLPLRRRLLYPLSYEGGGCRNLVKAGLRNGMRILGALHASGGRHRCPRNTSNQAQKSIGDVAAR